MNRAVFLDRDGVLNRAIVREGRPYAPTSLEQFEILPYVPDALRRLKEKDLRLIVVTNQPDIATGKTSAHVVEQMHTSLLERLPIDDVFVCRHTDGDQCACRKPKPGMLHEAAEKWTIRLDESFLVGDRWRDIEAGQSAGCKTVFINHGYREQNPSQPDLTVRNLHEASQWICSLANAAEEITI